MAYHVQEKVAQLGELAMRAKTLTIVNQEQMAKLTSAAAAQKKADATIESLQVCVFVQA